MSAQPAARMMRRKSAALSEAPPTRAPPTSGVCRMAAAIRRTLVERFGEGGRAAPILYGGSVNPANAAAILQTPEVGGALVGGASLKAADFLRIIRAAG